MKSAEAEVFAGVNTIVLSGTSSEYCVPLAVKEMVWSVTWTVAGVLPRPETFATLLNHR